jgi:hypothetical protein
VESLNQIQQESSNTLLGAHDAQQEHDTLVAHDLSAHDLVEMAPKGLKPHRQIFNACIRHDADFGILKGHGIAAVLILHNAVKPHDLTHHLEASDLAPTILGVHLGLKEACTHSIEGVKGVSRFVESATFGDLLATGNEGVELGELISGKPNGHTEFAKVTA